MISQRTKDFFWLWGFFFGLSMGLSLAVWLLSTLFASLIVEAGYVVTIAPVNLESVLFPWIVFTVMVLMIAELVTMLCVWDDERRGCYKYDL